LSVGIEHIDDILADLDQALGRPVNRDARASPSPSPVLFPGCFRRNAASVDDWLTEELERALARMQAGPVTPTLDMEQLRRGIAGA
jgi:hypothetical protein